MHSYFFWYRVRPRHHQQARCIQVNFTLKSSLGPVGMTKACSDQSPWLQQSVNTIDGAQINMMRSSAHEFFAHQAHRIVAARRHQLRHAFLTRFAARDFERSPHLARATTNSTSREFRTISPIGSPATSHNFMSILRLVESTN